MKSGKDAMMNRGKKLSFQKVLPILSLPNSLVALFAESMNMLRKMDGLLKVY